MFNERHNIYYRWALDSLSNLSTVFKDRFGYSIKVTPLRDTSNKVKELQFIAESCINANDDTRLLQVISDDYYKTFQIRVLIENSKENLIILDLIDKSFTYNIDLVSLFLKGVSLDTIELIIRDIGSRSDDWGDDFFG